MRKIIRGGSDDEVLKLGAILNSLSTQNVSEDGNNDVVDVVSGILDHGVDQKELNSDVLEAFSSEKESDSVPFNDFSNLGSRLVGLALVKHLLSLLHKSQDADKNVEVLVLNSHR